MIDAPPPAAADDAATRAGDRARSEFVRVLAHELRNYIAPIQNALHLLRLKARSDATLAPVVDIVERQLVGMTRALDAVSDADRIARGEMALDRTPADVAALVARALEAARAQLDARRHRAETDIAPGLPTVDVDASRIVRALAALLDNAARYAPEATRIVVTAREGDGHVEIAVADEGPGFAPEARDRAFEFFARQHRPGEGLGLGLPIAAAVARLHGGDLALEQPGRGSRLVLRLPIAGRSADAAAHPDAAGAPQEAAGRMGNVTTGGAAQSPGHRVLIADDSAAVRASLSDLLRELGHDVRAAGDGEEAVRMAQAWHPDFVLLDIHMPKLTGFAAARKLRALYPKPGMQLVMMSGDGLDDVMRRGALDAGFDHCIDKGLAIGELTELLARGGTRPQR